MKRNTLRRSISTSIPLGLMVAIAAPAAAQNVDWLSFTQDNSVLVSSNSVGVGDTQEKDYAWADLNQDGWVDLVSVRKEPFTSSGRRTNVLFMNEMGTLVDRTSMYATGSDVPGDQGFSSTTNDRDVVIADINNDGWLDVITATTLSPNQAKSVSHPRVYINLGEMNGQWQGLFYEEARIPDWGTYPNMCGLGVGDVTGDGYADLYFSHYEQLADVDLNDRLLINDGNGFFSDESAARMTASMRGSSFGTSGHMADMNGDGTLDIVSVSGSGNTGGLTRSSIAYNDPSNEGFFNILQEPYVGAPYHSATGDLNMDGLPDMILSDDGSDVYLLNQGNDVFGRVNWSNAFTFGGGDLGFASNNLIHDLDQDGWAEAIFCDVDVDIPGCNRRMQIMHNRGGTVGGNVTLREESGGGSWGAQGLPQLTAVHDVAIFDIDNDGDDDMVVGTCNGTNVFLSDLAMPVETYCDPAVANSSGNPAVMNYSGSVAAMDNALTISTSGLPPNQFAIYIVGQGMGIINNPGSSTGNFCLDGAPFGRMNETAQILNSGLFGVISLTVDLTNIPTPTVPIAIQAGETWNFQAWCRDNIGGSPTAIFSDAISVTFQ